MSAIEKKVLLLLAFLPLAIMVSAHPFGSAQWIGATTNATDSLAGRSIVVSREFKLRGKVLKAVANISGLGAYELYINHRKVGNDIMAPAWSDYNKTVFYNTYDLTSVLSKRSLSIDVLLGNGFFHEEGKRYHKLKINYGPQMLLFSLAIQYTNGSTDSIVSDGKWMWHVSPITFNSLFGGEDYDDRLPLFVPRDRALAVVLEPSPKGKLRQQIASPIRIMEKYPIRHRLKGMLFDMGQNLSGFPEVKIEGRPGQTIELWPGESLINDSTVSQKQTGKPHFYRLTIGPTGRLLWHARFSYYGYRYIQVKGAVMNGDANPLRLPVVKSLKSCFIYNSAPKTGNFQCSNERWNRTYYIIDRAIRSNWQHVWTDCPHREKLGWLEQDWLNGPGLVANYDCRSMLRQTMVQIADAQHPNGSMPEIAPEYIHFEGSWAPPFQESPEWGGALVALPSLYRDIYGNDSLIREYLPNMVRYVDYLATRDSSYILRMGLGDWYDYGPGRAGFSRNTPLALVSTAHYYRWTSLTANFALDVASTGGDPEYFRIGKRLIQRADSIKAAFNKTFYNQLTRSYGSGSQASNALPVYLKLVPDSLRHGVMESLLADIHAHGDRLTTGDVGTYYLYNVLVDNGQGELLFRMLDHDSLPGYGYQISRGMTTLSEQWNPDMGASLNHFMLGHINNHLISDVAGICLYRGQTTVRPRIFGNLTWVKAERDGIKVEWNRTNSTFCIYVEVPKGNQVLVVMPFSGKSYTVRGKWKNSEPMTIVNQQ